jgi:peptidoglycan/xylan/chitin deacetylase (PgdA/CDA1 family)
MRIPGLKTARLASRKLRSRLRGGAIVLGYHRVADSSWDPFELAVSPGNFAEQLEILRRQTTPVSLGELLESLQNGERPRRAIAVTFDDGYADSLTTIKPLLERAGVPASVFVVTGWLGREPWWDRLARILAPSRVLPESLRLRVGRNEHTWILDHYADPRARKPLVWELYRLLAPVTPDQRMALLVEISRVVGFPTGDRPEHRCLTREEVALLADGSLIQPGAHTDSHVGLGGLEVQAQQAEIETSKAVLEEVLGRPVPGFSYPHGSMNGDTRRLVRQAGFSYGCGSRPDAVFPESDPFELPRVWVPDFDGPRFGRWLRGWIGS